MLRLTHLKKVSYSFLTHAVSINRHDLVKKWNTSKGFTLIEVLAVAAILGVQWKILNVARELTIVIR